MQIKRVSYNPAIGAFEGRVDISRNGRTFRYPCQVAGPMTMDMDQVHAGLARHAMRMSDTGTNLMSSV